MRVVVYSRVTMQILRKHVYVRYAVSASTNRVVEV